MANNQLTSIKRAKETAVKNRAAAIRKASKIYDDMISGYDKAISKLTTTAKKVAPQKTTFINKSITKKKSTSTNKVAPSKNIIKKSTAFAKPESYPKDGTNLEKLIFFIHQSKRFISIQEVAEQFKKRESNGKPEEIKRRFSKHMNKFRQQGKIVSYSDSKTNRVYYGLPEYMKNGKVGRGRAFVDSDL